MSLCGKYRLTTIKYEPHLVKDSLQTCFNMFIKCFTLTVSVFFLLYYLVKIPKMTLSESMIIQI